MGGRFGSSIQVSPRAFDTSAPEEMDRDPSEFEIERPYLLFVGNPKPHKNLDNVIKAFARALEIHPFEADLVCVGDRSSIEFKVRQRASQLGLSDRLKLLGHVDDEGLPALYQGATLFLFPTLYEGFGLPVVEAMASRVSRCHLQHIGPQGGRRRIRPPGQSPRHRRDRQGHRAVHGG